MSWNFDNRLTGADTDETPGNEVTYQWDALARRVARDDGTNVTVFVQSDEQTIADYNFGSPATSPIYNYVFASYIDEPGVRIDSSGTKMYYHRNQQYSIYAVTDSSGNVVERYAYTAYGQPTILDASGTQITSSAINNRYMYTGREWDETLSLYHFRARTLDPSLGRFVNRDPLGFVDGLSVYRAYFAPTSLDPEGTHKITFDDTCTAAEQAIVLKAWSDAIHAGAFAIEQITALFDESTPMHERLTIYKKYRIFFEKPCQSNPTKLGEATLGVDEIVGPIQTVIKKTVEGMNNKPITIYCDGSYCDGKKFAYHYDPTVGYSSIVFCPKFFNGATDRDRAALAFHEATHKWGSTNDYAYMIGRPTALSTCGDFAPDYEGGLLSQRKLCDNASTYENFLWKFCLD